MIYRAKCSQRDIIWTLGHDSVLCDMVSLEDTTNFVQSIPQDVQTARALFCFIGTDVFYLYAYILINRVIGVWVIW